MNWALAIFFDDPGDNSTSYMNRDTGLALLPLHLTPPSGTLKR